MVFRPLKIKSLKELTFRLFSFRKIQKTYLLFNLESKFRISTYNQTKVVTIPKAPSHSYSCGKKFLVAFSIKSKSMSRLKAATIQTKAEKPIDKGDESYNIGIFIWKNIKIHDIK